MKTIYFVCTGGMGSSALGASLLKKQCQKMKVDYIVKNCAISDIPENVDWIVTHKQLEKDIQKKNCKIYTITSFSEKERYEQIVEEIIMEDKKNSILKKQAITLNCASCTSDEAIVAIGNVLLENQYIEKPYIDGMLQRDHSLTTYIGNHIAIPHGEYEVKQHVLETGLAVMIYPDGIEWHGEVAKIVIGIAAKNDDHMEILSNIACKLCEMEVVEQIVNSNDIDFIHEVLTKEEA